MRESKMMSRGSSVLRVDVQMCGVCGGAAAGPPPKRPSSELLHRQKHCKQKEKVTMT